MAEYTPKLKLLKKDPITDGNDTFNIKTMMNDNWDKIDDFAQVVEDKLNDVDDLEQTVNDLIEQVGNLEELDTDTKNNLIAAINEIYQKFNSHKEESVHQGVNQTLEVTSTNNATSVTDAPLKSAGGLAVAKDMYLGGNMNVNNGNYKVFSFTSPLASNEHIEIEFTRMIPGIHSLTTLSITESNTSNGDFLHYLFSLYIGSSVAIDADMELLSKGWTKDIISWEHITTGKGKMIIANNKNRNAVSIVLEMRSLRGYNVEFFVRPN